MRRKTDLEREADALLDGAKGPKRSAPKRKKTPRKTPVGRDSGPTVRRMTDAERDEARRQTFGRALLWSWT